MAFSYVRTTLCLFLIVPFGLVLDKGTVDLVGFQQIPHGSVVDFLLLLELANAAPERVDHLFLLRTSGGGQSQ